MPLTQIQDQIIYFQEAIQLLDENSLDLMGLDLSQRPLAIDELLELREALLFNTNLTSLDLSNTLIRSEWSARIVADIIEMNTGLKELKLWRCDLQPERLNIIIQALQKNTTLSVFEFNHNEMNDNSLLFFAEVLSGITALQKLSFCSGSVTTQGLYPFFNALLKNNTSLMELEMQWCLQSDDIIKYISKRLALNTSLLSLKISNNKITNVGATYLARALEKNTTLKVLILSDNEIDDRGAQKLGYSISGHPSLCFLDVSGNLISDEFMEVLKIAGEESNIEILDQAESNVDHRKLSITTHIESTTARLYRYFGQTNDNPDIVHVEIPIEFSLTEIESLDSSVEPNNDYADVPLGADEPNIFFDEVTPNLTPGLR